MVGIVGLGQIGGSLARSLALTEYRVIGYDSDHATCAAARDVGIELVGSLLDIVRQCDVIFCCVSIAANAEVVRLLIDLCEQMNVPPTVSDASSYKQGTLPPDHKRCFFIPGHPMAGSHGFGFGSSTGSLFSGAVWNLIIDCETDVARLCALIEVISCVGAAVHLCTQVWHDETMSLVSGLPHLLALSLGMTAAELVDTDAKLALAAGSFKGATRVLLSHPQFFQDLLKFNKPTLLPLVRLLKKQIERIESELADEKVELFAKTIVAARAGIDTAFEGTWITSPISVPRTAFGSFTKRIRDRGVLISRAVLGSSAIDLDLKALDSDKLGAWWDPGSAA